MFGRVLAWACKLGSEANSNKKSQIEAKWESNKTFSHNLRSLERKTKQRQELKGESMCEYGIHDICTREAMVPFQNSFIVVNGKKERGEVMR